jgi:hypothetical protein
MASSSESIIKKFLERPKSHRRQNRNRYETEFSYSALNPEDSVSHSQNIKEWIISLSAEELEGMLEIENFWMSEILRKMHRKNLCQGDGRYALIPAIEFDERKDLLENYFSYEKNTLTELGLSRNIKRFEAYIMFTDTKEYLDTFTLNQ